MAGGAGASGLFERVCRRRFERADLLELVERARGVGSALAGARGFNGPGAMGMTPPDRGVGSGVLEDVVDLGDSDSCGRCGGMGTGVLTREFFLDAFFEVRALLMGIAPLPRLRFLMTSVLSDKGRTTPCSLRKRPHALHRGLPSGFRRQRGVVCVKQFEHVVGCPLLSLPDSGLPGRVDAAVLKPAESCGELGDVCGLFI